MSRPPGPPLLVKALLAPLEAIINPRRLYGLLREYSERYGIYFTALLYFGAWIGAASITFLLTLLVLALQSLFTTGLSGLLAVPLKALFYSFVAPVVFVGVDVLLILLVAAVSPRDRGLHAVLAVRASSLLPYTLKVPLLAFQGRLSLRGLVTAGTEPLSLLLTIAGFLLTAYGLRRTMGMPWPHSLAAAGLPLAYKLALSL